MKTKSKTIKSILGCATACSALTLGGVGLANMQSANFNTYAVGVNNIEVSLTNPNFNNSTSSNYPFSPSGYTAYNQGVKVSSSDNADPNVQAGVINLSSEDYESRFILAKRTSMDNYVLMIDSTDKENNSVKHAANYGFQINNNVTLDKNSKYMFTVDVFTATNANLASLYLFDNNGEVFSSIKNVNSYNTWTTYTFFVATNNIESLSLKMGMYLEGAGTVLFDNLSAFKLSENEYDFSINSATEGTFKEENEKTNTILERYSINSNGQLVSSLGATSNFSAIEYEFNEKSSISYPQNSDGENQYAVLINNQQATYAQYETEDIFTFEANRVYQVSINVKTQDLNGTASLKLARTDIDENDDDYSTDFDKTISITTSTYSATVESVSNDYTTYSFYILSHPSKTTTYKLVFGLGSTDKLTTGKMYLSEIEISKTNYETYNSAAAENKITLVDAYKDSPIMLNNGDFNAFKIADYDAPIPATPVDWDVTLGKNTQKYGVVNTLTFADDLSGLSLSNLSNPSPEKNNNVLMMYNETQDTLSYKSASKSLKAKSYHKFEIDVQTQNSTLTVELVTKKDDNDVVLYSKDITSNSVWQTVSLFVHGGYQDLDVSLKLTLKTTGSGYAYVDNAKFDYLLTATQLENQFNSTDGTALFTGKVDFANLLSTTSNDKFATSQLFSTEKTTGVESGFITFNSNYLDEVIDGQDNLGIFNAIAEGQTDKKAIGIWSTDDVHYTMKSKIGFYLNTDAYYKLSIDVFTQNLSTNNSEISEDLIGANIGLTGFENTFTSIKSNNAWTTYTFYVKADSATTSYLNLELGNTDALAKGCVFFTNIMFDDSITEDEFNAVSENNFRKILKTASSTDSSNEEDKEETTEKAQPKDSSSWIFLIPSLLTAAAILIAVIGFAARKIKFKNPFKKKSKTSYDRNKTVSVQYYTRKATTMREQKVHELTQDLEKINAERKQFEEQYKHDLTKLREMKIKRANANEIAKLEKELKKNQKLSSSLGVTANKIADELKYAQTDMYLNSLVKKLAREAALNNKVEDKTENN